jgi:hypothetical protein
MDENDLLRSQPAEMPMYEKTLAELGQSGWVGVSAVPRRPTVTEMLLEKKRHLEYQLQMVNEALEKAKQESGAMGLIEALSKAHIRQEY